MTATTPIKIAIVGGGPAGLAAALHIAHTSPQLAQDMMVLEAAEYPRPKICGGGVTFHGEQQLRRLGLQLAVPSVPIRRLVFQLGTRSFETPCHAGMQIVLRAEFDAALAKAAADRNLTIRSGERLLDIATDAQGALLTTTAGRYRAQIVVAADGANSTVRRKLGLRSRLGVARLLRVMQPAEATSSSVWSTGTALFDFSCVAAGVQGYMWDFPSLIDGRSFVNHGIFDCRIHGSIQERRGRLPRAFAAYLRARNIDPASVALQGHPIRWFQPDAEFSRPHVLLAGDAAGVDPLFAEGISYAMEYGALVATAVEDAVARNDYSFRSYRTRVLDARLSRSLRRRSLVAHHLYRYRHPQLWSWLWRAAAIAPAVVNRAVGAALDVLPPPAAKALPSPFLSVDAAAKEPQT